MHDVDLTIRDASLGVDLADYSQVDMPSVLYISVNFGAGQGS